MAQFSQPNSDVSNATWAPTPLYPQLNDPHPGDTTYVTSSGSDTADSFEVGVAPVKWPLPGPQKLRIRWASVSVSSCSGSGGSGSGSGGGGGPVFVKVELRQDTPDGLKTITSMNVPVQVRTAFEEFTLELTEQQAKQIWFDDDLYARNLRVRVATYPPVQTNCCPNRVSPVLNATFSGGTGGCACMNGVMVELVYTSGVGWYGWLRGPCAAGGDQFPLGVGAVLECLDGGWRLGPVLDFCGPGYAPGLVADSCCPFLLVHTGPEIGLCCSSNITVTISEPPPR